MYKDENGKDIKIKSNFFIKLKKNVDIKIILHDYNITIDKQYSKQLYLANSEYDKNILEIIQNINNDENTLFASPNFDIKLQLR
ncbi:hypothetical protein MNB_ARC-1_502 [hydrothermal vent metagenome]|uniref:Uncharacterized protein n=1 Tax=hydrothermal vent metagenome TaxID=652676 RepID=A0A3B1E590_9ZZZZ